MEFSGGVIFHMFSATHQNAFKAIISIFRHLHFKDFNIKLQIFVRGRGRGGGQPTYGKFHMFFADNF